LHIKKNLSEINFINISKGEVLGKFEEGKNIIIKCFKKIKYDFCQQLNNINNNNKKLYFILTTKNAFILYK
jgi:hypothetical protein